MSLQELYRTAVQDSNNGHYAEAIRKLESLLTNDIGEADKANICLLLGGIYLMVGNDEEGVQRLVEALAIMPNNAIGWSNLSEGWRRLGRLDNALETARKPVALKPDNDDAHNNMGLALQAHGKLEEAIAAFHRAVTLKPNHNTLINLWNALQAKGRLDEAISLYHKAHILEPKYPDAHNNMGVALQAQGKLDEAV